MGVFTSLLKIYSVQHRRLLWHDKFTFPIFINYNSPENLVAQFRRTQGCGNRDFNNHNIRTQFSQLEIFGGVQWSVWFFSLILAGRGVMMKKPWTLSEINHKVQKNLLNDTEKLPLMFSVQFPCNWLTSSMENDTILFINICKIYILKIKLIKIFIHHIVSLAQYSPVKTCLKKTWNAIEPTCS